MSVPSQRFPTDNVVQESRGKTGDSVGLFVWLVVTFGAAAIGGQFPVDEWYAELLRPEWAPPNWIFGPVWTMLYLAMAVAAWLVWRREGLRRAWLPLTVYLSQLVLNATWSWLFFGRHRIDLALVNITLLLLLILLTTVLFYRRVLLAGILLLPYFGWVAFATALNFAFWRLNP